MDVFKQANQPATIDCWAIFMALANPRLLGVCAQAISANEVCFAKLARKTRARTHLAEDFKTPSASENSSSSGGRISLGKKRNTESLFLQSWLLSTRFNSSLQEYLKHSETTKKNIHNWQAQPSILSWLATHSFVERLSPFASASPLLLSFPGRAERKGKME